MTKPKPRKPLGIGQTVRPDPIEPPGEMPSNSVLAVHAHRVVLALRAEQAATAHREVVEARALTDGFPLVPWRRALDLMNADPEAMLRLERHTSVLLMAVRAGMEVEQHLVEVTTDISPEERRRRIRDEGYHAAVLGRPDDGDTYVQPDDRAVWTEGWHGFQIDLVTFEARRAVELASGAFCLRESHATVPAHTMESDSAAA